MNEFQEKELTVITPEHVQLQFQTAGIGSRAIAHLLDGLILIIFNGLLLACAVGINKVAGGHLFPGLSDYASAFAIIIVLLLNTGYFVLTEMYMGGQTPGKRILGLRVLQENGQSATFLSIIIRNLFRILDLLPSFYFLGVLVMLFSSKDKRIGDMVAGTIVIFEQSRERLKRKKTIDKTIVKWQNRLPVLILEEEARQRITSKDWQLLHAWMERLPSLPGVKREELSIPIARHFAAKLEYSSSQLNETSAYLVALYKELRSDWEV
ncbi:RDD family protein [Paenibacillus sp. GP183]|jgi:uncharacterized RDD family membrane protein YckC|uniref:RDD family protein n=1 Tax=Paenibacillus sp. GP183 TaxID=1882751 RepID=UPI00089BF6F2|nr:RDD family protein [Paenibacillus sp. GP183]SEC57543.1 Uncharacterized membrane protein YckC, RDD family [Paenibacillus sp. GP183]